MSKISCVAIVMLKQHFAPEGGGGTCTNLCQHWQSSQYLGQDMQNGNYVTSCQFIIHIFYITGPVCAYDHCWFFGDNFASKSFEQHYRSRKNEDFNTYVKTHFDIRGYFNNIFSDNPSVISRLANLMATAISQKVDQKWLPLPKLVVVVPDDDLINVLDEHALGSPKLFAWVVNYIMTEFKRAIATFKELLPKKCVKTAYPHILWIQAPLHDNFNNNSHRSKFNRALEDAAQMHSNTSVLMLKKVWEPSDSNLFVSDSQRFTNKGFKCYWEAVDRTVRYCDLIILKKQEKFNLLKQQDRKFKTSRNSQNVESHSSQQKFRWRNPKFTSKLPTPLPLRRNLCS